MDHTPARFPYRPPKTRRSECTPCLIRRRGAEWVDSARERDVKQLKGTEPEGRDMTWVGLASQKGVITCPRCLAGMWIDQGVDDAFCPWCGETRLNSDPVVQAALTRVSADGT